MDELRWILLGIAIIVIAGIYFFSRSRKNETRSSPLEAANDMPNFSAKDQTSDGWVDGVGPVRVVETGESRLEPDIGKLSVTDLDDDGRLGETPAELDAAVEVSPDTEQYKPDQPNDESAESVEHQPEQQIEQPTDQQPESVAPPPVEASQVSNDHKLEEQAAEEAAIDDVIAVYVLASDDEPMIKGEKILSASFALKLEYGDMKIFHRYSDYNEADPASKKIRFSMASILEPGWFDIDNINQLETRGVSFFMQVNLVDEPSRVLDDMLICAHGFATMLGARLCNPHRQLLDEAYTTGLREKVKKLAALKEQTQ